MQAVAQKSFAQRASTARASGRAARSSRAVVVCAAAEQSRRAVTGLLLGVASFAAAQSVQALTPVDLIDDRGAKKTGFDIIYEARDLSLDQSQRDGFTQARTQLDATKSRVKESEGRIDADLEPFIQKAYWTEAREQLRRQVGTLRFDLNALAETKPKADKKAALALKKEFLAKVEALDFSLREKNKDSALKNLASTKSALDSVLAAVL